MIVEVVAAVLLRADGAFLLARRPEGKVYAGWWEFPGGKVEAGESAERALSRELHEELGIEVRKAWPWITRVFTYEHATVRLSFFRVTEWAGDPHPREAQTLAWQRLDEPLVEPMLPANAPIIASLRLPSEYAVSAVASLGKAEFLRRLERRLQGGLRLLQLREKQIARPALLDLARQTCELAHRYKAKVLLNADVELALQAGADGVHFSSDKLMQLDARPENFLAGASCHDAEELSRAIDLELDCAVVGPVKVTTSHPDAPVLGWERFQSLVAGSSIPVYSIGGMVTSDMEGAWRAGAHGIAMISGAWRTDS